MAFHDPNEHSSSPEPLRKARKRRPDVTEARARAQRAKLDTQAEQRQQADQEAAAQKSKGKVTQADMQAKRRATITCKITMAAITARRRWSGTAQH